MPVDRTAGSGRVLVVEDESLVAMHLEDRLVAGGYAVQLVATGAEARAVMRMQVFGVCLLDLGLPDCSGQALLEEWRAGYPDMAVVVLTGQGDIRTAVQCLRLGAWDFLTKPVESHLLVKSVGQALKQGSLGRHAALLARMQTGGAAGLPGMVAEAPAMQRCVAMARQVAAGPFSSVLITGESGTGKGMLARILHAEGARAGQPFVEVNCSALPRELVESEFFGHKRGAFTDAKSDKPGLFELADGGILFLDEIGDMELRLQGKLLKVIEDQTFRRLGSTTDIQVDVALIAATNQDLAAKVRAGTFREDLYYRLNVIPLMVPPLRQRQADVAPMAEAFLRYYSGRLGKPLQGFTSAAMSMLGSYHWPGNARELRNVVERGCILARTAYVDGQDLVLPSRDAGALTPGAVAPGRTELAGASHAPGRSDISRRRGGADVRGGLMTLADAECAAIRAALEAFGGNRNRAADVLGVHRSTLYKKVTQYGLERVGLESESDAADSDI